MSRLGWENCITSMPIVSSSSNISLMPSPFAWMFLIKDVSLLSLSIFVGVTYLNCSLETLFHENFNEIVLPLSAERPMLILSLYK